MSGYFDPSPREASVAPPGYAGPTRSTTPFQRQRAALERSPQSWGSDSMAVHTGSAYVPLRATYEPTTHAYTPERSGYPPSDPRSDVWSSLTEPYGV